MADIRIEPPTGVDTSQPQPAGAWDLLLTLLENARLLIVGALVAGAVAVGITYLIQPTFTARTTFLPPQQQQSSASAALASLGALAGLSGSSAIKTPGDQYVALLQSTTVADRIVDRFHLMTVYKAEFRVDARRQLSQRVRISAGKKDGLITVEVDDHDRQRAADMANQYVVELRQLTDRLALTEAQQRRMLFEGQLTQTKERLAKAQQSLQASGFTEEALRAEPKAAAEGYAKLRAEVTAAEVRLQALRKGLLESTPEVQQQQAALDALRRQLALAERSTAASNRDAGDYVSRYREFKYQETLFELFSRQYEMARLDEAREGAVIQVVDAAVPPEVRSRPKRGFTGIATFLAAFVVLSLGILLRHLWKRAARDPVHAANIARLQQALRRR